MIADQFPVASLSGAEVRAWQAYAISCVVSRIGRGALRILAGEQIQFSDGINIRTENNRSDTAEVRVAGAGALRCLRRSPLDNLNARLSGWVSICYVRKGPGIALLSARWRVPSLRRPWPVAIQACPRPAAGSRATDHGLRRTVLVVL